MVLVSLSDAAFIAFPVTDFSLRWHYRLLEYTPLLVALWFSLKLAAASAILAAILGVPAALALARSTSRAADLASTFLLAPLSIPMILLGVALLYNLSAIGLGLSFTSLLIAHTVVSIPYVVRTVVAVYRGIGRDYEESAAILGASNRQIFTYVTLPLIGSGVFSGMLFAILISLDNLSLSLFFERTDQHFAGRDAELSAESVRPRDRGDRHRAMAIAFLVLLAIERTVGLEYMSSPS